MNAWPRPARSRLRLLARCTPLLLAASLAACTVGPVTLFGPPPTQTLTLATVLPRTGADALLGQVLERAVDLAVNQNAVPGTGYRLTVRHVDEAATTGAQTASALAADASVIGIVGPLGSDTAAAMLPVVERQHLVTISPDATLLSLTQPGAGGPAGLTYTQLHPKGASATFFRLSEPDTAAGQAAAALAVAAPAAHGLGAHSVFVVDDGSASGMEQASAFTQALSAAGGASAGTATLTAGSPDAVQAAVIAIIRAQPDAVFYAGDTQAGAALRRTLTLSGAPQLVILTTGTIAANPGWSADVGLAAASAYTVALLPEQISSTAADSNPFVSAYRTAFGGHTPPPQAALAYDAAMDEIAALKAQIATGKPVTRAGVLASVAAASFAGANGTLAFNANGDPRTPPGFTLYTCDTSGVWSYQSTLQG